MNRLTRFFTQKVEEGRICGYSLALYKKGQPELLLADGHRTLEPEPLPVLPETLFDLASLTKPLATAYVAAWAVQEGLISLTTPLSAFFPALEEEKKRITLLQLLCHSSGVTPWKPLYAWTKEFPGMVEETLRTPLDAIQGTQVFYSCLNYILVKAILEKVTQKNLPELFKHLFLDRLNLTEPLFCPPQELQRRTSATERGNLYEQGLAMTLYKREIPKREGITWGVVHDGNSYFAGGTAGNSGLFGSAEGVCRLGLEFLPSTATLLKPETLRLFTTNFTPFSKVHRSVGFILKSSQPVPLSPELPPTSFFHLGFTGTSVTLDPEHEQVLAVLMNRVHPTVREPSTTDILKRAQSLLWPPDNV